MISFLVYPFIISFPLSLMAGAIGSILVWRRSSFLSDVIAHMGILAFAISEIFQLPILWVSLGISILTSCLLEWRPKNISKDAWLSGLSSFGIACGLVLFSRLHPMRQFEHIFWGDFFNLTLMDVMIFIGATAFLGMHVMIFWKSIILIIFHEQLAQLDGIPVTWVKFFLNIITGIVISLCLNLMGVLLTGTLFVLPSIILQSLKLTPERHWIYASVIILCACCLGLMLSVTLDMILAPLIVLSLIFFNFFMILFKKGIDILREK